MEKWTKFGVFLTAFLLSVEAAPNSTELPKVSKPLQYDVDLRFKVVGSSKIDGTVKIDIEVVEETDSIFLHSRGLTIKNVTVTESLSDVALEQNFTLQPENDFLIINVTSRSLFRGDLLSLAIIFTGTFQLDMKGIYRTSYSFDSDTRKFLVATQFGGKEARSAFVCYDEPEYKATFMLSLNHESAYTAISVSDVSRESVGTSVSSSLIEETPKMSVQDFGFVVVSDYYARTIENSTTIQRFYSKLEDLASYKFALDNAALFMNELESYVSYKYEFATLSHVAISELDSDSIGFWGLITYNAEKMQRTEKSLHHRTLKVLEVVANSISRQFFGDLVTPREHQFLWLTEGFASFFESLLIEAVFPEARSIDFFNLQKLQSVLKIDAIEASHVIASGYDFMKEMSPHKTASIIRMFKNVVGDETFKKALQSYLLDNAYGVVTSDDLYHAFEISMTGSELNFTEAFMTWELQSGYPVISVAFDESASAFNVSQERFSLSKRAESDDTSTWYIPLNFAFKEKSNFEDTSVTEHMIPGQKSMTISKPATFDATQWFVFNKQQLGFYRVNYDVTNWYALIMALNSDDYHQIHVLNRAQLVDDSLALAAGGYLDYQIAFGILSYLVRETEFTPWSSSYQFINQLYTIFGPSNTDINTAVRLLSENFYLRFEIPINGVIPEEELYERFGRELAIKVACSSGNEICINGASASTRRFLYEDYTLPQGFEFLLLCNGMRGSGKDNDWEELWEKMQTSSDSAFKSVIITALACSDNSTVLTNYLETTIKSSVLVNYSVAERRAVMNAVLNSAIGFEAVTSFMKDFQLDILVRHEYEDLNPLPILKLMAEAVKSRNQEIIFLSYLSSLSSVAKEDLASLNSIVENNFAIQNLPENIKILEIIHGMLPEETSSTPETTTVVTTLSDSPTTTTMEPELTTVEESTTSLTPETTPIVTETTSGSSTETTSVTTIEDTTSSSTSAITNPPTISTSTITSLTLSSSTISSSIITSSTVSSSSETSSSVPTPTVTDAPAPTTEAPSTIFITTDSASNISLSLITVFTCVLLAISLRA